MFFLMILMLFVFSTTNTVGATSIDEQINTAKAERDAAIAAYRTSLSAAKSIALRQVDDALRSCDRDREAYLASRNPLDLIYTEIAAIPSSTVPEIEAANVEYRKQLVAIKIKFEVDIEDRKNGAKNSGETLTAARSKIQEIEAAINLLDEQAAEVKRREDEARCAADGPISASCLKPSVFGGMPDIPHRRTQVDRDPEKKWLPDEFKVCFPDQVKVEVQPPSTP